MGVQSLGPGRLELLFVTAVLHRDEKFARNGVGAVQNGMSMPVRRRVHRHGDLENSNLRLALGKGCEGPATRLWSAAKSQRESDGNTFRRERQEAMKDVISAAIKRCKMFAMRIALSSLSLLAQD